MDGVGLFGLEVERSVFFVFVEEVELGFLVGVDDSENVSNGFVEIVVRRI